MADDHAVADVLSHIETVTFTQAVTRDQALRTLADKAMAAGWAKSGYGDAVLRREAAYPTGLHTLGVEIAIPHADAEWTLVPAMLIGVLDEAAAFQPMGGQGGDVMAKIILLLVIPNAEAHLDFLRALVRIHRGRGASCKNSGQTRTCKMLIGYLRQELRSSTV